MAQDELTSEPRPVAVNNADDDQAKIQTYEEAFRRIKEATGVSDTQACVLCCLPMITVLVNACVYNYSLVYSVVSLHV